MANHEGCLFDGEFQSSFLLVEMNEAELQACKIIHCLALCAIACAAASSCSRVTVRGVRRTMTTEDAAAVSCRTIATQLALSILPVLVIRLRHPIRSAWLGGEGGDQRARFGRVQLSSKPSTHEPPRGASKILRSTTKATKATQGTQALHREAAKRRSSEGAVLDLSGVIILSRDLMIREVYPTGGSSIESRLVPLALDIHMGSVFSMSLGLVKLMMSRPANVNFLNRRLYRSRLSLFKKKKKDRREGQQQGLQGFALDARSRTIRT